MTNLGHLVIPGEAGLVGAVAVGTSKADGAGYLLWLAADDEEGPFRDLCVATDDALDAVLCVLLAGLAARGQAEPVPREHVEAARTEGWIALRIRA